MDYTEELYLRLEDGNLVHIFWSDNPPADPETAVGVLSLNIYSPDDHHFINGVELDAQDTKDSLVDYLEDLFDFADIKPGMDYEIISEEDFNYEG